MLIDTHCHLTNEFFQDIDKIIENANDLILTSKELNAMTDQKVKEMVSNEVYQRIKGLDKRTYSPRIRTDLFDL